MCSRTEKGDCDERGGGDQQQHGVEGVDEERQLVRHVTRLAGGLCIECGVDRERDDDDCAGQCDRGGEENRPASSGEEVFQPEPDRQRQQGSGSDTRKT